VVVRELCLHPENPIFNTASCCCCCFASWPAALGPAGMVCIVSYSYMVLLLSCNARSSLCGPPGIKWLRHAPLARSKHTHPNPSLLMQCGGLPCWLALDNKRTQSNRQHMSRHVDRFYSWGTTAGV
jgi:hypothetical protein